MKQSARSREETLLMLSLAWPCILENVSSTLVSLVDTAMVGSIGAVATAAVGACTTPVWLLNGLVRSLGVGGTALVARAIGADDRGSAEHTASQVFRTAVLLAIALFCFFFFGAGLIPRMMRVSAEVLPEATAYARIFACGFLFHYTGMCMGALLRGAGDTRTPMISGLMANVLNILGNFLMIYPTRELTLFGIRVTVWGAGLGVRGAALASAVSMGIAGLYILVRMLSPGCRLRLRPSLRSSWDLPLLKRVLTIAAPAALERISINVGQILFAGYISSIGTAELAAYHITTNIEALGYMPANGFQAAATALVGQKLGAKEPEAAQRLGRKAILYALGLLTVIGGLLYLLRQPLAGLFTADPQVLAVTVRLLILCALVQPFNALTIVTVGALNGAGDTRMPFVFSLVTMWAVRIVFSNLLGFTLGYGVMGIYFSMILDLAVRSALLLIRFHGGRWKTVRV